MHVQVTYFKPSGKMRSSADWELPDGTGFYKVLARFNDLLVDRSGAAAPLPGLASARWDGYVVLQIGAVPHLLNLTGVGA